MSKVSAIQSIRGMNDWDAHTSARLQQIEQHAYHVFTQAGFLQVRLPVLEKTELFVRSVGNDTDIVAKELYSFADRNEQTLSLRPECTAGLVRAVIENSWWQQGQLCRYQYLGPMFRRERPQKGRYRQFTQFGAEVFGSTNPMVDSEVIQLSYQWLVALGLDRYCQLHLNTIGQPEDRKLFRQALMDYLMPYKEQLDEDSRRRLETNPLRILDTKVAHTQHILMNAPRLQDFISIASQKHFKQVLETLDYLGIRYHINRQLVRGLDYYNDTVFEWVSDQLGSQSAVCGGGRYDGLMSELGGKDCPAFGFAAGLERIEALLQSVEGEHHGTKADIYIVCQDASLSSVALAIAQQIRSSLTQLSILCDTQLGSLKSQLRRADKSGADIALVIATEEYANQSIVIKPLRAQHNQRVVPLSEIDTILPTYF